MIFDLLWLVPAMPFASFLVLAILGKRMPKNLAALFGVGSIGLSAALTIWIGITFLLSPPPNNAFTQVIWSWIGVGSFNPQIAFRLDALSLLMMFVVTFVGFLIHLYSSLFMADDDGFSRFFTYMNLFVGSMLVLVMGDNLLLLYLGWEGVGLCSYLLIGFWYKDPDNGYAARKAFVVTRVGDTAMSIGLFLLFTQLGTLNIQQLLANAQVQWPVGSGMATAAALLLLGGAVGKSAQLPLQTWLPDAMAGPTPVSALIHAATMVTAGVYLIARTNVIFTLAPVALMIVAIVGALTLLLSGFAAMAQRDIKRVLAYSTISQIGYMFLGLGVGAWSAAMFHFMIHAFFKALLFLGAGVLIINLHHEHDMFKMGGMRKQFPLTFWTFLIGGSALAAVPLITAGFYSKDTIIWYSWISDRGSPLLWLAAIVGALLTAFYTFRMIFVTFFGESKMQAEGKPGFRLTFPLVVLAVLSLVAGFIDLPDTMGHFKPFTNFLHTILPPVQAPHASYGTELFFQIISAIVALGGIYIMYIFYIRKPSLAKNMAAGGFGAKVHKFWFSGLGFDWLYDRLFVYPYVWIARINKDDVIDRIYDGIAFFNRAMNHIFSRTQTGNMRSYATGIAFGAVITVAILVFL
jgi:NADH-quinone oxidoreductase subunit L